ncbi:MAG: aminopeptidase, partial [Lachnospiraceae bacterium]
LTLKDAEVSKADEFCVGYMQMLKSAKTERLFAEKSIYMARAAGFLEYDSKMKYNPGDRVYVSNRGKAVIFAVFGKEPIESGIQISAAHIDSPRLDLKPNPLYENNELAYFKTHYYGGIKKYQWVATPLALHGVVIKKDGTKIDVVIGEDDNDPVIGVSDLLVHLAGEQMQKKANEFIAGEDLNILVGNIPAIGEEKDAIKKNILNLLKEKYDF